MSDKYQITAYQYNTRKQCNNEIPESDWAVPIPALLQKKHTFLPFSYDAGSYLFRGMSRGFFQAVEQGGFGRFNDDNPHSAMEDELEVLFVSHELSDALTCARPWESEEDFVVLMIQSEFFNRKLEQKKAAMMAFSEPGFIFKYPFFVDDFSLHDIACFVVGHATLKRLQSQYAETYRELETRLLCIDSDPLQEPKRKSYEQSLLQWMHENSIRAAKAIDCESYPV